MPGPRLADSPDIGRILGLDFGIENENHSDFSGSDDDEDEDEGQNQGNNTENLENGNERD